MAYFEDRYFCENEDTSITVSLWTGSQPCFTLLAELQKEIDDGTKELEAVERHLEVGRDPVYRWEVQQTLQKKLDQLTQWQTYMRIAIGDYEKDLFIRVKSIVSFYVKPVHEQLLTKIQQADLLLARTMLMGDTEQYHFITEKMQEYYYMKGIVERIREATTFDDLLPFVKIFVGERAPAVTSWILITDTTVSGDHGIADRTDTVMSTSNDDTVSGSWEIVSPVASGGVFLPRDGSRK